MPKQGRKHGTRSCHQGGCQMPECIEAQRTYAREWAQLDRSIRRNPDHTEVPATAAAQHIKELNAAGMGLQAIANACGMQKRQLWSIANGKRVRGIRVTTERRILAVTLQTPTVPPIGSQRRIQALCALGHTMADIEAEAGIDRRTFTAIMRQGTVTRNTAERITAAYEALSMRLGTSATARRRAHAKGWAPPLAWDDEAIDDPTAEPVGFLDETPRGFELDDWWHLVRGGENPERAAARCGVSIGAVERAAYRAGRTEIVTIASRVRNNERWKATA